MNVYDFDGTIYHGDSSYDFFFYMLKKKPDIIKILPKTLVDALKYKFGKIDKTELKQTFYQYLTYLKGEKIDKYIKDFWKTHIKNIYPYYLKQQKKNDVIISASPTFLLAPVCKKLGVKYLLASNIDKKTGVYEGVNCFGEEKVKRFFEKYPKLKKIKKPISSFYTDSNSDMPLALIAKKAYKVNKNGECKLMKI